MKKTIWMAVWGLAGGLLQAADIPVQAVIDQAHGFTFYNDGRFARQYLPGARHGCNFAAFDSLNLSNLNLFVVPEAIAEVPYTDTDVKVLEHFAQDGGTLLILSPNRSGATTSALETGLGYRIEGSAQKPLKFAPGADLSGDIVSRQGCTAFKTDSAWTALVSDGRDRPVVMTRSAGKGRILLVSRSMAGQNPDGKDNINASWLIPLIKRSVTKVVDTQASMNIRGLHDMGFSEKSSSGVTYHYSAYLKSCFEAMKSIETRCRPMIEKRMGVPLHGQNGEIICLLATGGGGFSAGQTIALAVFWENFPHYQPGMIEFITHESVHSWVHPFTEVWNEPIATYVGDLVMQDMGYPEEGAKRIRQTIERAVRLDSSMTLYDLHGNPALPGVKVLSLWEKNDIHWGKSFWVWEQLRAKDPEIVAKYFKMKRQLANPAQIRQYRLPETVTVLSKALGEDLFGFFNSHGMKVSAQDSLIR